MKKIKIYNQPKNEYNRNEGNIDFIPVRKHQRSESNIIKFEGIKK